MSESDRSIALAEGLTREYLLHHRVCPTGFTDDGAVRIAAAPDALLDDAVDDLRFVYGRPVRIEPVPLADVERAIERLTARAGRDIELARADRAEGDDERTADVRDLATQPPVVRFVNLLVRDAYDAGASDIHLESARAGLTVRFRLDGVLTPAPEPPGELAHAVVSRIKLLAELDIAERRRPQDGRIRVRFEDRAMDLRVSTVPTLFGESVVLRLLDRGGRPVALEALGMPSGVHAGVSRLSSRPHGMVLVTGPTGSGKTTTLYAALQRRDTRAEKVITVEDPVEYELDAVTQVPVHRPAGVTFAAALRSILRQDPDVVMLGEMRDPETAEVAVQAAMTGHVVFSTLHTNDAVGAIPRLVDLGVAPYLIAATLEGVLAQRLVRRICEQCREPDAPDAMQLAAVSRDESVAGVSYTRGGGCAACRGTGYRGRLGVFELFTLSDETKHAIAANASRTELLALARAEGMRSLMADGWTKVVAGETTIEEVWRVAQG
ncbi:MAG TPA: GspE/PulE family protein [Gemmatimonadaceae bacterium]|nr:GspE/PulE family protein [Gemmatimonadaceae bacterium]